MQDDGAHLWVRLARRLGGQGVPSVEEALLDERLGAIHAPVSAVVEPGSVAYFLPETPHGVDDATLRKHLVEKLEKVLAGLVLVEGPAMPMAGLVERLASRWARAKAAFDAMPASEDAWSKRHLWFTVMVLDAVRVAAGYDALPALRLDRPVEGALRAAGFDPDAARRAAELAVVVSSRAGQGLAEELEALLETPLARRYLDVHEHGGVTWFDKERFEALCAALEVAAIGGEAEDEVEPLQEEVEAEAAAEATAPVAAPEVEAKPAKAGAKAEPKPKAGKKAEAAVPAPEVAAPEVAPAPLEPAKPVTAAQLIALAAEIGYRFEPLCARVEAGEFEPRPVEAIAPAPVKPATAAPVAPAPKPAANPVSAPAQPRKDDTPPVPQELIDPEGEE